MPSDWLRETAVVLALLSLAPVVSAAPDGPLRIHPENPYWLMNGSGEAVYLAGSHTWAVFQERGIEGETPDFDFEEFLGMMRAHNHTFLRLWSWEHPRWMQFAGSSVPVRYSPMAYARTGPGMARDGNPKFDVSRFNDEYFARLRHRVEKAGEAGIHAGVMLFQGFSTEQKRPRPDSTPVNTLRGNQWMSHPFHRENNINGIDGDRDGDDEGREVHTLDSQSVLRIQENYVRRVIETLGDLDHIVWEICNECDGSSMEWQNHMARFIRAFESTRPKQHLVWISVPYPGGSNELLFESDADLISPNGRKYLDDPPVPEGKVVIVDDDHISPLKGEFLPPWKAFLRGNHYILMDGYRDFRLDTPAAPNKLEEAARIAMGQVSTWAKRIGLGRMRPDVESSSTGYCLADPGREYLVYDPEGRGRFEVRLPKGQYRYQWYNPTVGYDSESGTVSANSESTEFVAPFPGRAVLWLRLGP